MNASGTKRAVGGSGSIKAEEVIDDIESEEDSESEPVNLLSVSSSSDHRRMTKKDGRPKSVAEAAEKAQGLDEFLAEMFQTTATGEENGMPSLEWLKEHFKTKSAAIRYLYDKGFKVKDIHKHLGLRYQHVRNVLTTELKRGPNETFKIDDYQSPNMKTND